MKRLLTITLTILCFFIVQYEVSAQERFSKTLNLGLGVGGHSGYSRYAGQSIPVFHINYELGVVRNFTLAPFVSFYTYTDRYYWSGTNSTYIYRETVIPVGVKGTYYFDELLEAHSSWDFYASGSAGFAIVNSSWQTGYDGDKNHYHSGNPVFLDVHIGAEYHFSANLGVFLDLSSGISTIGLAVHPSR
jgi:hypothetical protein